MAYKPGDFLVGVVDHFAVLLPNAAATFLLGTVSRDPYTFRTDLGISLTISRGGQCSFF